VDGQLATSAIRSLKQSVNRSRYSQCEDVLFSETGDYNGLGVIELKVSDIPGAVVQDGPTYIYFMLHEPEHLNYSHSVICSENTQNIKGKKGACVKPSPTVSLRFRMYLCRRLKSDRILIEAEL
jgi:hypothetical protein